MTWKGPNGMLAGAAGWLKGSLMIRAGRIFAWVFAVGLFVAGVWFGLISLNVTVDEEPTFPQGTPFNEVLRAFYDWFVTRLTQERLDTVIAIVAFVALIGVGLALREALGRDRPAAVLGAASVALGSVLWIVANLVELGSRRAVEVLVRRGHELESVNSIFITFNEVADWLELGGFAVIGAGILAFGAAAIRTGALPRSWGRYSLLLGGFLVLLSIAYAFDNADLVELLLLVGAVVLAPTWGVWVAVLCSRESAPGNAR